MKILVVYPYFVDKSAAGHSLMYDTLQTLVRMGHDVTVVSGETGYMEARANLATRRPWWRRLLYTEWIGGIRVYRTLSYTGHQKSFIGRVMSYLYLCLMSPLAVMVAARPDVVLLSPPPLYPIFTSFLACLLRRLPVMVEVRDLWPDSLVQMGVMRNPFIIRGTAWMERCIYDRSSAIVALTQGIADNIVRRGWRPEKVHELPCAVDPDHFVADGAHREQLRVAHGWTDKFVLLYFGALGEANNLGVIVRAAQRLAHRPEFRFVLVGDGFRRAWLEQEVRERELTNVEVLPPVPKAQAAGFLAAADACVVTLQDLPVFAGAIPTKLIEYMAGARPVLCGVRGEARRIVESAGGGYCFEPDDDEELVRHMERLRQDPAAAQQLGAGARRYVQAHFDITRRSSRIASLLQQAAQG
ncbi:glycosyltransferase family 4 protein [Ramlibacter sp. AN1133]|uniref:glycosyltransferase family 4 protein n=1 Tax=Ramlibacter sp. AN1133 TaxID=3133429 RepID=UPI0030BF3E88